MPGANIGVESVVPGSKREIIFTLISGATGAANTANGIMTLNAMTIAMKRLNFFFINYQTPYYLV
jgi:hypothetical protein